MTHIELESARRLLCGLQDEVLAALLAARRRGAGSGFSRVAGVTAADTIYRVDRIGEAAILDWFGRCWPRDWPVEIVMEGLPDGHRTFPRGTPASRTRWRCVLDPIDGTRCLMHDKRPAWSLAALAPQRGPRTTLDDIRVAAMTELPVVKQGRVDQLSAVRGRGVRAERIDLAGGPRRRWRPRPSRARDFAHGFAGLVRFFPEAKARLAAFEEDLWRGLGVLGPGAAQPVFEDQYLSTGGQLYELLAGHDRMVGDLRPRAYARAGCAATALSCHPYDLCTALIAREAGCVIEAPEGGPVRCPLDTTTPVAWMGYANPALARRVRPVLRRLLRRHF